MIKEIIVVNKRQKKNNREFNEMGMLGPSCIILYFSLPISKFSLPTSIRILVFDVSQWQVYFTYLSPKCLCKDSIDKMHEVLILDAYFNAWT